MKMISKIANVALGLVFVGSSVFAQSLMDAKKAIEAEQYQKAKGMLKNLTATQPTNDENVFYLGWVYLQQDYIDSAKLTFAKGVQVNPKSSLNYVGLGITAYLNKDEATANLNFKQGIDLASKKDAKPYLYIGKGYLLGAQDGKLPAATANAAIDALNKGKTVNPKDAEIFVALGDAYRSQLNSNDAYTNYATALSLDPKSPSANVSEGVLWVRADNYEDAEKQFQAAITIDPNFGPAYREWAESNLRQAKDNIKVASEKVKEGVEHYKKYLSLTDESVESLLRYADFLVNLGDYKTLQEVAAKLTSYANANARIYRYLGYAAYETKDYTSGLTAMDTWFKKAEPKRILPLDYMYLGRLQIASGKDTIAGVANLKKAAQLDTNKTEEAYTEIIAVYKKKNDRLGMATSYDEMVSNIHGKLLLVNRVYMGLYYYLAFTDQARAAKTNPAIKPDSTLLTKADSALSFVERKETTPSIYPLQYRAKIADQKDADFKVFKGTAAPYYEQIIKVYEPKTPLADAEKNLLADAYAFKGNVALYRDHDETKADEWYTKAKNLNPGEYYQKGYFENKAINAENEAAKKAAEEKKAAKKPAGSSGAAKK